MELEGVETAWDAVHYLDATRYSSPFNFAFNDGLTANVEDDVDQVLSTHDFSAEELVLAAGLYNPESTSPDIDSIASSFATLMSHKVDLLESGELRSIFDSLATSFMGRLCLVSMLCHEAHRLDRELPESTYLQALCDVLAHEIPSWQTAREDVLLSLVYALRDGSALANHPLAETLVQVCEEWPPFSEQKYRYRPKGVPEQEDVSV